MSNLVKLSNRPYSRHSPPLPISKDGVNVTVGGGLAQLHKHIEAVETHPMLMGKSIDFKLAETNTNGRGDSGRSSGSSRTTDVIKETGFDSLCVRLCKVWSNVM